MANQLSAKKNIERFSDHSPLANVVKAYLEPKDKVNLREFFTQNENQQQVPAVQKKTTFTPTLKDIEPDR